MKTTNIILLMFLLLTVVSCSKSDDDSHDRFEGTMEAKVNGELVKFYSAWGDGSLDMQNKCLRPYHRIFGDWEARTSNGHRIVLNFYPSQGIGTYNPVATYTKWEEYKEPLSYNSATYNQHHFDVETQTHYEEDGVVTITSTGNNRYIGTFYFTAVNENGDAIRLGFPEEVTITEGKFEILKEGNNAAYPPCNN